MQLWKSSFLTLSCHLLEIFQNKYAVIIHGKNTPRFVQYTASTTVYEDPIVLDIKKKMCECVYAVCVCTNTHFISNRIKNQVKEDGLERVKEGYMNRREWEVGPGKKWCESSKKCLIISQTIGASPNKVTWSVLKSGYWALPQNSWSRLSGGKFWDSIFFFLAARTIFIFNKSLKTTAADRRKPS